MLRLLAVSLLSLIVTSINAQQLNPSWNGRWEGGDTILIVTQKNVINQGKICRWTDKAPTGNFEGCLSHYAGGVKKSELLERFDAMQAAIKEQASSMDAAAKASAAKTVQALKAKLEQLSNDTFRILTTSDADYQGSGDCGAYYIWTRVFHTSCVNVNQLAPNLRSWLIQCNAQRPRQRSMQSMDVGTAHNGNTATS